MKYATTDKEAAAAIAAIIAEAAGGLIGIDTETMPHESERRRLAELRQMQLAARGTLKAAERLRGQAGQADRRAREGAGRREEAGGADTLCRERRP